MDDTRRTIDETIQLQKGLDRLNAGDASVRGELLNIACQHLMRLTAQIQEELAPSPGDPQSRLPPKDLFSGAAARLYEALHATPVKDARHFYQLASLQIRRELIEICSQQESDDRQPFSRLQHFYDCVDRLPEKQREVFELIWYHEIPREEVAQLLGADVVEIRRLWRSARLALHDRLDD